MAEVGLGQLLREAREARGLSVADVARGTHIRPTYIEALEEERFTDLPAPVYIRGFLRNYATFLGLDAEELVATLDHGVGHPLRPHRRSDARHVAAPVWHGPSPQLMASALALLLAVGFIAFLFRQYSTFADTRSTAIFAPTASATAGALPASPITIPTVTPIPAPPSPSPTPRPPTPSPTAVPAAAVPATPLPPATPTAQPASPTPTPPTATPTRTAPLVLNLAVKSACWMRVTVDGMIAFEGTLQPGTARTWEGTTFITLRAGNAGGVAVTFNGKQEGILGAAGQVVEKTYRLG